MNIYTVEEREAQAALELVKALEDKHGWQGVGVQITENKESPPAEGFRNIAVKVTPPNGKALNYEHYYALDEGLLWPDEIVGQVDGGIRGKGDKALPATASVKASEAPKSDAKPAVVKLDAPEPARGDAPKLAEQPKAKAAAAPTKQHAGKKTTVKGKRS